MGDGTDEGPGFHVRGMADGRACVTDIETSGMTEILLEGRDDVIFARCWSKPWLAPLRRSTDADPVMLPSGMLRAFYRARTRP